MKYAMIIVVLMGSNTLSCADFDAISQVKKFKVLAVSAEPPEVHAGESSTFTVLFADPKGQGRQVSFAWVLCAGWIDPSFGLSTCEPLAEPWVETVSNGGDVFTTPPAPSDIGIPMASDEQSMTITAVIIGCAGGNLPEAGELMKHRDESVISELCEGGDGFSASKSVIISDSDDPNRNPVLDRLEANGSIVDTVQDGGVINAVCDGDDNCGAKIQLEAYMTADSHQTHEVMTLDGPEIQDEYLYVSWFTTDGEFDSDRSDAKSTEGPYEVELALENPGTHTLWVVARDIRGGVSWRTYRVAAK